jgi:hypothetical protein
MNFIHVIANEVKQSSFLEWIAASLTLLAMTGKISQ